MAFTGNTKNLNRLIIYLTLTKICIRDRKTIEEEEEIENISNAINNSLKSAALAGETKIIKCLLTKEITNYLLSAKGLKEALSFAANNNHVKVVNQIIQFLTNTNHTRRWLSKKAENITDCALIYACSKNHVNVIAALIINKIILKSFTNEAIKKAFWLTTNNNFQEAFQILTSKKRIKNIYLKKQRQKK